VSEKIVRWLGEQQVQRVLEVGAGIGNTATRMRTMGWDVVAIEPDPILFRQLEARMGPRARSEPFLQHVTTRAYDAIIAESVFFMLDLPTALRHAGSLLKPGGCLALVDAVWSDRISAAQSERLHDLTASLFGIPVASRQPMTHRDWLGHLSDAGFAALHAERLPPGSTGQPPSRSERSTMATLIRSPDLLPWMLRFRWRMRRTRLPAGALESWLFLAQRAPTNTGTRPHRSVQVEAG